MKDQHKESISTEMLSEVLGLLSDVNAILAPVCPVLTPKERESTHRMSDEMQAFSHRALNHAQIHPELTPPYVDPEALQTDMDDVYACQQITTALNTIHQQVNDLAAVAGTEAANAARSIYHFVQRAAADGVAGAKPAADDLGTTFANRRHKSNPKLDEE